MLNFIKRKKNKPTEKASGRLIDTRVTGVNVDDFKFLDKPAANDPAIKFEIDVEYHQRGWKMAKELREFIALREEMKKNYRPPPFALFPYTAPSNKDQRSGKHFFQFSSSAKAHPSARVAMGDLANAEAPFIREIRLALDTWLDSVITNTSLQHSPEVAKFLDWARHKSIAEPPKDILPKPTDVPHKITQDDYVLLKVLGKGSFGKVLLVRKKTTAKVYAMKMLKKQRVFQRHQVEHTKTERRVLGYLKHPFLVSLHEAFQTDQKLFLVLDYCAGGELFFHLSKAGRFTEERTRFYTAEIVLAIEYLHSRDIIYRDLKPENILLDSEGHVKLTDFGLCKEKVPDNGSAHSFCGTPEYLAPEILKKVGHGKAADWWTCGALIYEMLCGVPPFYSRSRDALFDKILRQKIRFPNYFSRESVDIIKQLMSRNPKHRLGSNDGSKEVKMHIFFTGIDWARLLRCEIEPPFRPRLNKDKHGVAGGGNFDPEFTGMPIHSPGENNKRKFAPFEDFTFRGHNDIQVEDMLSDSEVTASDQPNIDN